MELFITAFLHNSMMACKGHVFTSLRNTFSLKLKMGQVYFYEAGLFL